MRREKQNRLNWKPTVGPGPGPTCSPSTWGSFLHGVGVGVVPGGPRGQLDKHPGQDPATRRNRFRCPIS